MKAWALAALALSGIVLEAGAMYDSTDAVEELTGAVREIAAIWAVLHGPLTLLNFSFR